MKSGTPKKAPKVNNPNPKGNFMKERKRLNAPDFFRERFFRILADTIYL